MAEAWSGCEQPRRDEPERAAQVPEEAPLAALDLLAIASRAATAVASQQGELLEGVARCLRSASRRGATVWAVGGGAAEHARRLAAAGYAAATSGELESGRARLQPGDLLLLCVRDEAPRGLLEEARRRKLAVVVLAGPEGLDREQELVLRVPCRDAGALELAQAFIVMALCAEQPSAARAASAERALLASSPGLLGEP